MAAISVYLQNKFLDHVLQGTAYSAPSTRYLALFTAATGLSTNAPTAEVSGGSYQRMAVAFATNASNGQILNTSFITYPVATAPWGTITYLAIMDASSNGNVLFYGAFDTPRIIDTGNVLIVRAGDITASAL